MGHRRRRGRRAGDAGQILFGVSDWQLLRRCALSSATAGLFRLLGARGFRDRHVHRAGAASALADGDRRAAVRLCAGTVYRQGLRPFVDRSTSFHPWHCNDTCDSDCDLGSDCGKPPQEVFSGLSDNEPWLVAAVSCQRRNHRLSGDHFGRTRSPHAADLGITRSFPVRHSDCLRHKLPDRTLYSVNLAVLVIGIAAIAVVLAAPLHAYHRNFHPLHEGRNFYQRAVMELTQRWHEHSDAALAAVGGDEGLAFATAFYSPDQPVFEERLVVPHTEALPRHASFERGWAALCYHGDIGCIASMERIAARDARFVRTEFEVQSTLLGQPGATQGFTALIVPPSTTEKDDTPETAGIEGVGVLIR